MKGVAWLSVCQEGHPGHTIQVSPQSTMRGQDKCNEGTLCPQTDKGDTQSCLGGVWWLPLTTPWLHVPKVQGRAGEALTSHRPPALVT